MCKTLGKYIPGSQQLLNTRVHFEIEIGEFLKSQNNRIQNYRKTDLNSSQRL